MRDDEPCCLEPAMMCGCCTHCDQDNNPDCECETNSPYCWCDPDEDDPPPCAECGAHNFRTHVEGFIECRVCKNCYPLLHRVTAGRDV